MIQPTTYVFIVQDYCRILSTFTYGKGDKLSSDKVTSPSSKRSSAKWT